MTTQAEFERCAVEFLGWRRIGVSGRFVKYHDKTHATWHGPPGPTPAFFFALWDRCVEKGFTVDVKMGVHPTSCMMSLNGLDGVFVEGPPLHALAACVVQFLDMET